MAADAIAAGGLSVRGLTKAFGKVTALRAFGVDVAPGEILAVTGPSGAGKTTLCRLIAGLEAPDHGTIGLAGRDLLRIGAGARRIAYLFESYALFPHFNVFQNVVSPLKVPGRNAFTEAERRARVEAVLALLGIDHLAARRPSELSGGQKQRVGLARALVQDDAAITLLDEPISHLDAKLRHRLRGAIRSQLTARDTPTIWLTPDGLEALSVGDRVAVLIDGVLEQLAPPAEIWNAPASVRVARLIGDPPTSIVTGALTGETDAPRFRVTNGDELTLAPAAASAVADVAGRGAVTLGIKPRALRFSPAGDAAHTAIEIFAVEPFGKHTIVSARLGDEVLRAKETGTSPLMAGARAHAVIDPAGLIFFDAHTGARLPTPPMASVL